MYKFLKPLTEGLTKAKNASPFQTYMQNRTFVDGKPYAFLKQLAAEGNPKYKATFKDTYQDDANCVAHAMGLLRSMTHEAADNPNAPPKSFTDEAVKNLMKFADFFTPTSPEKRLKETEFPTAEEIFQEVQEKGAVVLVHDALSDNYSGHHAVNVLEVWEAEDPATGKTAKFALLSDADNRAKDAASNRARSHLPTVEPPQTLFEKIKQYISSPPQLSDLPSQLLNEIDAYESKFRIVLLEDTIDKSNKAFEKNVAEYAQKAVTGGGFAPAFRPVMHSPEAVIPELKTDPKLIESFKLLIKTRPDLIERGEARGVNRGLTK